jgi:aromatic-L-amino-acid/L-tryptophan decarboxylase
VTHPAPTRDQAHAEFRRAAAGAVDWVAEYLEMVSTRPVAASVAPGEIAARLPAEAPAEAEPIARILDDLTRDLLPGITHWNHPRFFAYVPQSAPPAAIVADLIVSALNVNGLLWETSPTLTELEQAVLAWLGKLLGLPSGWFGQTLESASLATLTALTVARERGRRTGGARRGRVVCSSETHASAHKAARLLDLTLTVVDADEGGRMPPARLERALADDDVCAVVATVGTTSTAAVDPIREIAARCRDRGVWLHVDGAYASAAAICPEHAHVLDGIEAADSFVVNAHKWLGLTAACSCFYTPHRDDLRSTFATAPDYLDKGDDVVDLVDYGPMFSRRLSALKLWFALRAAGVDGLRDAIRTTIELARELGGLIAADPAWELCSQRFGVLCFRLRASDEENLRLLRAVNRDGRIFISGTRVGDRPALRVAIGNRMTTRADVATAWEVLRERARHGVGWPLKAAPT